MKHGSLFSGIGGFDLAAEWMGWENVFHCEWMEFPRKVLDYHFPNADSHIDICKTDFTKYANKIDVVTGGFPCQPFSIAGKRKGKDDERYLWGEMLRAIQEIKPKFVIGENVFGITNIDGGLVFQQVCLDLEAQGYEVQPFIIPACAKNAPHRRDRCWFVATNSNFNDGRSTDRKGGCEESKANGEGEQSFHSRTWTTSNEGNATDTKCKGLERHNREREECSINRGDEGIFIGAENKFNATDTNGNGFNQCNGNDEINASEGRINAQCNTNTGNVNGDATNTESEQSKWIESNGQPKTCKPQQKQFGRSNCQNVTTNTNGTPTQCSNSKATQRRKNQRNGFEALCQSTNWDNFPTQSPICGGDDGLPTELDRITFSKWRAESIKGYGNSIVPQIAYQLFQILETL